MQNRVKVVVFTDNLASFEHDKFFTELIGHENISKE